jgi:hypothetical protein
VTLPDSTVYATYTLANGTAANTNCRLLDWQGSPLTNYSSCIGAQLVTAPTTAGGGIYGYSIQANKAATGETVSSSFIVSVSPEPIIPITPVPVSQASCTAPWGSTIASGVSVIAFLADTVTAPATCSAETRTCTDGYFSGSYQYASCTVLNPSSSIKAASNSVRNAGDPATISWTLTGITGAGCTITKKIGKNTTTWKTGLTSSSSATDPVTAQTTYSLSCPSVATKSVIVTVVPSLQEF